MTNHPNRRRADVAAARKVAQNAGYYIREGSYHGTTDDRIGRWYVGHKDDEFFRPYGAGHRTQGEAWMAAAEDALPLDASTLIIRPGVPSMHEDLEFWERQHKEAEASLSEKQPKS